MHAPRVPEFSYDNRTGRPPGRVVRALSWILPGVRQVQRQVHPYADAWVERNRASLASSGPRWIALGDSMTQGVGASSPQRGWVDQLNERLHPQREILNFSATGARVRDVIDQQLPVYRGLGERPDDLITVLIGSNDIFGRGHKQHLPEAMAELIAVLPRGTVICTLPNRGKWIDPANEALLRAGREGHLAVVDIRTAGPSSWSGLVAADRFHPNDPGYAAIADAFEPAVRRTHRALLEPPAGR